MRNTPYTAFFKPLLDRALALVLLLPWCLLFVPLVLLVKLTSKGPAFFKQRRVGRYKNVFLILKFRTMYTSAPADTPTHLLKDASSFITPVGKFLRKSSLDELPQLINILRGDMSFVGPRPALWNQDDLVAERDRYHANDATPGITGWAQVTGRDELPIAKKAKRDGYYAAHVSLVLDAKIVFKTFFNVLSAKGVVEGSTDEEEK